jgi:hypothetical protein
MFQVRSEQFKQRCREKSYQLIASLKRSAVDLEGAKCDWCGQYKSPIIIHHWDYDDPTAISRVCYECHSAIHALGRDRGPAGIILHLLTHYNVMKKRVKELEHEDGDFLSLKE